MRGGDEMKKWGNLFSLFVLIAVFSVSVAEGAGTLKVTFKYRDSNGVEQPLSSAYVYLRNGAVEPPMEKYFSPADYILGPSDALGRITASVPEGTYYVRITRRNPSAIRPLGPPEAGDYTWYQTNTITIGTNTVTDFGTKYAKSFLNPITISGTITTASGAPLAGRYVRAQTDPCISANFSSQDPAEWVYSNLCGFPAIYLAPQRTDAGGRYTIQLREPGTYYIYESQCLGDHHQQYSGNPQCIGTTGGTVTVTAGDSKTVNVVVYPPYY